MLMLLSVSVSVDNLLNNLCPQALFVEGILAQYFHFFQVKVGQSGLYSVHLVASFPLGFPRVFRVVSKHL